MLFIMDFDDYAIDTDAECISQDIADIDLYAEKLEEEDTSESNILFE